MASEEAPPSAAGASSQGLGPGERDAPGVLVPPPVYFIASLAIGFALEALLPSDSLPPGLAWPVGGVLLAGGLLLAAAFFAVFRRARTPVDVRKPTATIVTTGPYRFTRNPGYLSLALIYSGIATLTSALWAFVPLVPVLILVDRAVIRREERYLERKFGEDYTRYKASTRRWI